MQQLVQQNVGDRISALMRVAGHAEPGARGRLYDSVADLMIARGSQLSEHERGLARQILAILTRQVETEVRRALALRLAERADAPHDVILMLANDTISVAEPVLTSSPVLTESDLVLVVRNASSAHHHVIARRPDIGTLVSEALLEHGNDNVLGVLLANNSARLSTDALRLLLNRAQVNPSLQAPLAQRADLPQDIIHPLYAMVSAALRAHLESVYELPAALLDETMQAAANDAATAAPSDEETRAARLIDKLERAKTLGPSFLLKALAENQLELFVHGFARLLRASPATVRQLLASPDFRPLALATRALGIDRSVFLTIFNALRSERKTDFSNNEKSILDEVFVRLPPQAARAKLARLGLTKG